MFYRDVTDDPGASSRLKPATSLIQELQALGFRRLGLMETDAGRAREVTEVWASADGRAFAEPELAPGGRPLLWFRSILQDGTIVDTAGRPFLPIWLIAPPRCHNPGSGHHVQRLGRASVRERWEAHRALLGRIEAERGSPAAAAVSVDRMATLCRRSWMVSRLNTTIWALLYLGAMMAILLGILASGISYEEHPWFKPTLMVCVVALLVPLNLAAPVVNRLVVKRRLVPLADLEAM